MSRNYGGIQIIGSLDDVFRHIDLVSKINIPVQIRGETGTGKELVARAIHHASDRSEKPFTPLNICAIPENLIESELYGYEKGAFTGADKARSGKFEDADGGIIFLDEIGACLIIYSKNY